MYYKDDPVYQEFKRELLSREYTTENELHNLIDRLGIRENERWIDYLNDLELVDISISNRRRRQKRGGYKYEMLIFNNHYNE